MSEWVLIVLNIVLMLAVGWPMARQLQVIEPGRSRRSCFFRVVALYLIEGVALVMGMGIPILNLALAFVWGWIFGRKMVASPPAQKPGRIIGLLSFYSSLPVLSFLVVPLLALGGGWSITSPEEGFNFGLPAWLPWPLSTIAGFYLVGYSVAAGVKLAFTLVTSASVVRKSRS